jgi:hypothetical protein
VRITLDWLKSVGTPCGADGENRSWNAEQKTIFEQILGHSCAKGWTRQLSGKHVSAADAKLVEELRGIEASERQLLLADRQPAEPKPVRSDIMMPIDDPERAAAAIFDTWHIESIVALHRLLKQRADRELAALLYEAVSGDDDDVPF